MVFRVLPADSLGAPGIVGCTVPPPSRALFLGFPNWLACFLLETGAGSRGLLRSLMGQSGSDGHNNQSSEPVLEE